jgi:hypothetical protein
VVKTSIWLLEQKYCRCSTAERVILRKKTVGDLVLWELPYAYLVNLHIFEFSAQFQQDIHSSFKLIINLSFHSVQFGVSAYSLFLKDKATTKVSFPAFSF